ncbi:type II secretion system protein GspG [bacterium]|nr:type II secretion system protein GspG [bacterium]
MSKGMTLVEIMVVVVIIGILGTFVALNVFDSVDDARESKAVSEISSIETAVKRYRLKTAKFPQSLKELVPKYIEDESGLMDPWDNEYVYKLEGSSFKLFSKGPDGQEGNADDISNKKVSSAKQEQ